MRDLTKDEIELRIGTANKNGVSFLLYKTARVDMQILDETYGVMGWRNHYEVIKNNLYCTIEVYDKETNQWVGKTDCGVESQTEAEKGEASDAFKRAGFRWGIGRELYTAPFIWVKDCTVEDSRGKTVLSKEYRDMEITDYKVAEGKIVTLEISANGKIVYSFGKRKAYQTPKEEPKDYSAEISAKLANFSPEETIKLDDWFTKHFSKHWKQANEKEAKQFMAVMDKWIASKKKGA